MTIENKKEGPSIAAIVIAKNEEANLARCLSSLGWVDEIILIDSYSEDRTVEIASHFGAKTFQIKFEGYGATKAYGVQKASGDWVLSIDADEEISPRLANEIRLIVRADNNMSGYFIPRRTCFLGRWINHSRWYPDYVLRLFRKSRGNFDSALVHEKVVIEGKTGHLNNPILHHSYPDGNSYLDKMKRYTSLGAEQMYRKHRKFSGWSLFLSPLASFYRHYIFGAGFLDGMHGFLIGLLSAFGVFRKYRILYKLEKSESHD